MPALQDLPIRTCFVSAKLLVGAPGMRPGPRTHAAHALAKRH